MFNNHIRREAQAAANQWARTRMGIIDSYDPAHYAVKVRIQPENVLTGWIPLGSSCVGKLFGMFCGPSAGDMVDVHFQEGGKEAGYASIRLFSTACPPLPCPSGEFWLVHKSGSQIKLTNDGKVLVQDSAGSLLTLNADGTATLRADLRVQGSIIATGDITDLNGTKGSVQNIRDVYDAHEHPGVQSGGNNTGIPNEQL